jgi:hypothetical protein
VTAEAFPVIISPMKLATASRILLAVLLASAPVAHGQEAARSSGGARPAAVGHELRAVRLLVIGNSFSADATAFLDDLAAAGGHTLVFGHASIPGCPLDRHVRHALAHEKDPDDREGKPYTAGGKKVSLREMLQSNDWDYVTIQQASIKSFNVDTYRPFAKQLADYVGKYAPRARVVLHETWAYRADNPMFSEGRVTRQEMYDRLHAAYHTIAEEIGAAGVIPVGTAFENALNDPRWVFRAPGNVDRAAFTYPDLPAQANSLHVGYKWPAPSTRPATKPAAMTYDGSHASTLGRYLGACTWYEFFYGDVRGNAFAPDGVTPRQAATLQEVARDTVRARARGPEQPAAPSP